MTERNYHYDQTRSHGQVDTIYDEGLRRYMLGVYNYMCLGIAATGVIAFWFTNNPDVTRLMLETPVRWLPFIGILGIGFFAPRIIMGGSKAAAHGIYWLYVALWAAMIGPFVAIFVGAGYAQMVYQAFFITSAVFGSMSLYGYTTKKDLSPMGKALFMIVIGLLVAMIANALFFKSGLIGLAISGFVVIVFSLITAYQTQMIKNLYVEGAGETNDRAAIIGAFTLYGTFATLFIHILNLLSALRE